MITMNKFPDSLADDENMNSERRNKLNKDISGQG